MMDLLKIAAAAMILASTVSADPDPPSYYDTVKNAHAVLGCLAFALLFPVGAMTIRLFSSRNMHWVHATWMMSAYCIVLAGIGMGIWMAIVSEQFDNYHPIIGLVVAGCLLLQPVTGLVHHLLYKKSGKPNAATYPHLWWGRAIITLGIINGGLGLQLTGDDGTPSMAYGAVAGIIWVLWMLVIFIAHLKSRRAREGETGDNIFPLENKNASSKASSNQSPET